MPRVETPRARRRVCPAAGHDLHAIWKTVPRFETEKWAKIAQNGPKSRKTCDFGPIHGGKGLKEGVGTADAMNDYMTSITKQVPVVPVGIVTLFAALAAKVRASIESLAPIGYQDDSGFHTGTKPRGKEIEYPAAW